MDTPIGSRGSTASLQSMDAPSMRSAVSARTRLTSQSSLGSREEWAPLTIPTAPSPVSSGRTTALIYGRIPHSQQTWSTGPLPSAPTRVSSATPGSWEGRMGSRCSFDLGATTPRDYRPIPSSRGSLARTSSTDLGAPHRPAGYRAGYGNYFNSDATLQDSSITHSTLLPGSYAVRPQTPAGHYLGPQAYERYLGPRGANPAFQGELSMTSSGTPRGFTDVFE